jgi:ammonium transporter, Amt family
MSSNHRLTRRLISAGTMIACLFACLKLDAAEPSVSANPSPLPGAQAGSGALCLVFAAIVVMFMHIGFAMTATGFCRAKNALNTVAMNLMILPLSGLAFWAFGFAVGWGNFSHGAVSPGWSVNLDLPGTILNHGIGIVSMLDEAGKPTGGYVYGLAGGKGFFLSGIEPGAADAGVLALFFFMLAVICKAALIPVGAMVERWRWNNFCLYGLWVVLPLALCANWVWGGGWLAGLGIACQQAHLAFQLGHGVIDFSGAGVIHLLCGLIGLVGAWLLGPRTGKYRGGRPQPLPAHHVPMIVVGSLILAFGWLGWNAGFALSLSGTDFSVSGVAVNTTLATCAGTLAAMVTLGAKKMKPDPTLICNGLVAGLVAISGPCPFVDGWAAVIVGAVAGSAVVAGVLMLERRGIDDPVGAISVHGVAGLWGLLAVGIFANGRYGAGFNGVEGGVRGLLYGDPGQFAAQLIGAAVIVVFGLIVAWSGFQICNRYSPMRVLRDVELEGLDGPELGALAYPDFSLSRHA